MFRITSRLQQQQRHSNLAVLGRAVAKLIVFRL
jgi:hypothetical protein